MRVIIICRGDVNASPTVSNYINAFKKDGCEVYCISSFSKNQKEIDGVDYYYTGEGLGGNPLSKIMGFYSFRKKALKIIKNIDPKQEGLIWVARIDTAISFWNLFSNRQSVITLHEMHDKYKVWKTVTKKIIHSYDHVVYNEINRANIARVWYNLSRTPTVIPNKPSYHPLKRDIEITDQNIKSIMDLLSNKKIIVYQGSLQNDRNLDPLINAFNRLDSEYHLLILGKDTEKRVNKWQQINPNISHIEWVAPPNHLFITSHCYIGVAVYDYDCLNSIYCAPNKIWEYSGFKIPILAQNIPGLINTVGLNRAGVCTDIEEENSIVDSIKEIDSNYKEYSENAYQFYNSVDFNFLVKKVLSEFRS